MRKGKILQQFKNFRIYKDLYRKSLKRDWVARVVSLIQILLIFGGRWNRYFWDIYMAENLHVTRSRLLNRNRNRLLMLPNFDQSGISLNLRTGPTGQAPLFNQLDGALVFINKQIKTSPQWSKIFKTTDGVGQNQSSFRGSQAYF